MGSLVNPHLFLVSPFGTFRMSRFLSGLAFGLVLAQLVFAVNLDQEVDEGIPDTGLDTSNWTTGVLPPLDDMITLNDFQMAAKNVMSRRDYTQYRTGVFDEASIDATRKAFYGLLLI
jgi:hypothetical protein